MWLSRPGGVACPDVLDRLRHGAENHVYLSADQTMRTIAATGAMSNMLVMREKPTGVAKSLALFPWFAFASCGFCRVTKFSYQGGDETIRDVIINTIMLICH